MAPALKIRELLAAKTYAKGVPGETKGSTTPSWKLKLQSRTGAAAAISPIIKRESQVTEEPKQQSDVSVVCACVDAQPADDGGDAAQQQPTQAEPGAELKLTIIQPPPLLPKPELTRPTPPTDRATLLRQLQGLRAEGCSMLAATPSADTATPGPIANGAAALPAGLPPLSPAAPSCLASPAPATTGAPKAAQPSSLFGTPRQPQTGLTNTAAVSSPLSARMHAALLTPSTPTLAPYTIPSAARATDRPGLSTPSMVELRQQESKDTGGGFLTHFADPRDIAAPLGAATLGALHGPGGAGRRTPGAFLTPGRGGGGGGGIGGGATGSSTPLSVLRSIHKVQQLQRLQREGAQLVAEIEGGRT